ncbi:HNH endonuclease [Pseudomonas caspiana]|uniref:HNH endonuclease n=1 Tax=Pseudomonas caspiana TaxID=1451454 RepID=UPI0032ED8F7A
MIKLERAQKPIFLSNKKTSELTQIFKETGNSVWNHEDIKKPLLQSSNEKCAYCECCVSEESKYMEVEHFKYKNKHHDLVVDWLNLLPSCKRCNIAKSDHDVEDEPIINPYDINPREHLKLKLYKLKGVTELGKATIEAVDLNNSERLVLKRFDIGQQLQASIETATERLELWIKTKTTRRKNKLLGIIETILLECQCSAIYSATTATIALNDEDFLDVIEQMKTYNIWSQQLETLLKSASTLTLIT